MSLIGNILWLIFGGFWTGISLIIGGLLTCATIIGIPFGIQAIKLGIANFLPFGMEVTTSPQANHPLRVIFNVIWIIFFGWPIALLHLFWACVLAITLIGIPFAIQHIKLLPLSLLPFGRSLREVSAERPRHQMY